MSKLCGRPRVALDEMIDEMPDDDFKNKRFICFMPPWFWSAEQIERLKEICCALNNGKLKFPD